MAVKYHRAKKEISLSSRKTKNYKSKIKDNINLNQFYKRY